MDHLTAEDFHSRSPYKAYSFSSCASITGTLGINLSLTAVVQARRLGTGLRLLGLCLQDDSPSPPNVNHLQHRHMKQATHHNPDVLYPDGSLPITYCARCSREPETTPRIIARSRKVKCVRRSVVQTRATILHVYTMGYIQI